MSIFKKKEETLVSEFSETTLMLNKDDSIFHLNLQPEQVADTILTVGDSGRVHIISQFFDSIEYEIVRREFVTHTGYYKGKRMTVISSGAGVDSVELLVNELDALVNIDIKNRVRKEEFRKLQFIRIGTASSLQESMPIGSYVINEYAIGLDSIMSFYDFEFAEEEEFIAQSLQEDLNLPFRPYCARASADLFDKLKQGFVLGNTVTTSGFYAPQGRELRYKLKYPHLLTQLIRFHRGDFWLTTMEMETAGLYAMAKVLGHEAVAVNAITTNRINETTSYNPNKITEPLIKMVLDKLVEE